VNSECCVFAPFGFPSVVSPFSWTTPSGYFRSRTHIVEVRFPHLVSAIFLLALFDFPVEVGFNYRFLRQGGCYSSVRSSFINPILPTAPFPPPCKNRSTFLHPPYLAIFPFVLRGYRFSFFSSCGVFLIFRLISAVLDCTSVLECIFSSV